jgi:hypothetical protein
VLNKVLTSGIHMKVFGFVSAKIAVAVLLSRQRYSFFQNYSNYRVNMKI